MEAAVVVATRSAASMSTKSANAKMGFLRALNVFHKTKMFGKNNSEPLWKVFRKHPITRGMASYLVIWPTGNIIQQTLCEQEYDWWKVMRFGLYGCFITAPSLYCWVKLATFMYPNNNLRLAMAKVRCASLLIYQIIVNSFRSYPTGTNRINLVHPARHVHFLLQYVLARDVLSSWKLVRSQSKIPVNVFHSHHNLAADWNCQFLLCAGEKPNFVHLMLFITLDDIFR
jgi:hypothetical protein